VQGSTSGPHVAYLLVLALTMLIPAGASEKGVYFSTLISSESSIIDAQEANSATLKIGISKVNFMNSFYLYLIPTVIEPSAVIVPVAGVVAEIAARETPVNWRVAVVEVMSVIFTVPPATAPQLPFGTWL
jgi:hypothetical protein